MKVFAGWKAAYVRFAEKQGFPIIVTVCVAVITATALWTGQQQEVWVAPTPPPYQDLSAAQLLQQSLRDATTAVPAATPAPAAWRAPLTDYALLQGFSSDRMVYSSVPGLWSLHAAADLGADAGAMVHAMADGTITAAGQDQLQGAWLLIDHGNGTEALYAGMALIGDYRAGDTVQQEDVIGYCGAGLLAESDMSPHLHLRVTRNGTAVDPCTLWQE